MLAASLFQSLQAVRRRYTISWCIVNSSIRADREPWNAPFLAASTPRAGSLVQWTPPTVVAVWSGATHPNVPPPQRTTQIHVRTTETYKVAGSRWLGGGRPRSSTPVAFRRISACWQQCSVAGRIRTSRRRVPQVRGARTILAGRDRRIN